MSRTIWLLGGVLLAVATLGSGSPKEYNDRTEYVVIEGTWRLTRIESNGEKNNSPGNEAITFLRETYTNHSGEDTRRGTCRIDPARKPPHLDLMPSIGPYKGETIKKIYQIDGDMLRIGSQLPISQRPQGFNDPSTYVEIYKRVK
jgi:uncharacterized protein (TIGR03067 family)